MIDALFLLSPPMMTTCSQDKYLPAANRAHPLPTNDINKLWEGKEQCDDKNCFGFGNDLIEKRKPLT